MPESATTPSDAQRESMAWMEAYIAAVLKTSNMSWVITAWSTAQGALLGPPLVSHGMCDDKSVHIKTNKDCSHALHV